MSDDPESAIEAAGETDLVVIGSAFSGPLPPPDVLADYEAVVPGAAERILSMSEQQLQHSMDMDRGMLGITRTLATGEALGHYASLLIAASSAVVAIVTAIVDPSWVIGPIGSPALLWTIAWALRGLRASDTADEPD